MRLFEHRSEMEMMGNSGRLQVNIRPKLSGAVCMEVVALAGFLLMGWSHLLKAFHDHPIETPLLLIGLVSGLWYQMAGSEELEFDPQQLVIRKNRPWWRQNREYPLDTCTGLEVCDHNKDRDRFRMLAAGRLVSFGRDLNVRQAYDLLDELEKALPGASYRLLKKDDPFTRNFTLLNLG
jgi:hypothetical protein